MSPRVLLFFILINAAAIGIPGHAISAVDHSDVSVKVEVDHAFITIGDRVNFKVTVSHPKNTRILSIAADEALSDFEIKSSQDFSFDEKDISHTGKNFVLTSYELGEYVIRPIRVEYEREGKTMAAETNQLYLTVQSIGAPKDEQSDIRGIKGVMKLSPPQWIWVLLVLMLSAVAGLAILRRHLNRRKNMPDIRAPELSAHEEAYQALQRLQFSDLLQRGEVKLYFMTLSEIIRRFLERRFLIRALESTTTEICTALDGQTEAENHSLVQNILELCDFVKFAKYRPDPQEIVQTSKQAREIVDRLKETITPAESAAQKD